MVSDFHGLGNLHDVFGICHVMAELDLQMGHAVLLTFGCGVELLWCSNVFNSDLSYSMVAFFMVAAVDFTGDKHVFIHVLMGSPG